MDKLQEQAGGVQGKDIEPPPFLSADASSGGEVGEFFAFDRIRFSDLAWA